MDSNTEGISWSVTSVLPAVRIQQNTTYKCTAQYANMSDFELWTCRSINVMITSQSDPL